jgi:predicted porin
VSGASGAFLEERVRDVLPGDAAARQYRQRAFGADAEVSHGYWLVRTELVSTDWRLPALGAPPLARPLRATSWLAEGRYKLAPGLYAAARYDRMFFNRVPGTAGSISWDASLWRVEAGGGYSVRRNVMLKASYQYNRRDGGLVAVAHLAAAQVALWF